MSPAAALELWSLNSRVASGRYHVLFGRVNKLRKRGLRGVSCVFGVADEPRDLIHRYQRIGVMDAQRPTHKLGEYGRVLAIGYEAKPCRELRGRGPNQGRDSYRPLGPYSLPIWPSDPLRSLLEGF
jgi:hypothetical protein